MAEISDFSKAAVAWTLPWDADWVTAVTFLGPTRTIAAGNNLGEILLWELPDKTGAPAPMPLRRLDGHTNAITRLLSSPDGRHLISASNPDQAGSRTCMLALWQTKLSAWLS